MAQSPSSSGIFFEGDEQSQALRNSHFNSFMFSNMVPVSGEGAITSPGMSSLVTDANSGPSEGNPSLKRSASINNDSYARLPASPLSFNSNNNISISGSTVIDSPSTMQQGSSQQGIYHGASTATSLPNPRVFGQNPMFHGPFVSDHDNVSHLQKKPRYDIKQDDILQQQLLRKLSQRQDPMQMSNQQLEALYYQQQVLRSLSPSQQAQLIRQMQQKQQLNSRQNFQQRPLQPSSAVKLLPDGGLCARKLMQYLYHQRQRTTDISYWRKFVAEYYSPRAKQRWCLSVHNNVGHHPSGVFPASNTDVWQCSICQSKSGRGFAFEILARLNQIKFASGVLDELWFLDKPEESRLSSGLLMLEYGKAIQESVYAQLHVVHEGRLKVIFTPDLKILSWEFCSRRHQELLPRGLLAPQVNKMLEVAQKWQSAIAESGSGGVSQQDLQTSSNMLVTAVRQLARSLDVQSLNDLGFTKRYVRCLQIAEVVTSMKDLMDFTRQTNVGPIEALKRFPLPTTMSKSQIQNMQGMEQISHIQGIPNDRSSLSGPVALHPEVNSSMNNSFQAGSQGALALSNYQNTLMRKSLVNPTSQDDASSSLNRTPFQAQPLQNNSSISFDCQHFPSGIAQVQQNHHQQQQQSASEGGDGLMVQQIMQEVLKGMKDNNGSREKPSISGQSGGEPTRSNSFKAGSGSYSDSCAGGEKAPDLPHVSDICQDIISEFTENGFF
uniref:probable transcriptional regulator SLK2 isoform X2 n=1 Tax=Erigeron canadensis TaxID=72917 RepID=UPI001CB99EC5|nr:probable transcriptional regulator SLK2 isoform X2 [Erigeron canadensis]